jgi:hypothetical protein
MNKPISVYFPPLNGGEEIGFNDAGVEQFKHDRIESLMRECTQNSTDALDKNSNKKFVKMEFKFMEVPLSVIPGIADLREHFKKCLEYVSVNEVINNEKKAQQFFENALKLLTKPTMPCLLIRDYNTTGLSGEDEDRHGKWFSLVRARGSSNKASDTAGGSFGIGKSAPFACSALRTVFYGTKYNNNKTALQGKSLLITHLENGNQTQGVGFIGIKSKDKCVAIRENSEIPQFLQREENGTDILIVGFTEKDWINKIKSAALRHFWPALELDKIQFEISDNNERHFVSKTNLDSELAKLEIESGEEDIREYLATFRKGEEKIAEIKNAGGCKFRVTLSDGNQDYSNKVCCFRNNAMVIEYMSIQIGGNFNGIFYCDNDIGSKIFREMEPPRHDKWTWQQPQEPEDQKRCKDTFDDMRIQFRDFVKELLKKNINESVDPDELELNVQSQGNTDSNSFESLEPIQIDFKEAKVKPVVIKPTLPKPEPSDKPAPPFNPAPNHPIPIKKKYPYLRCFLKSRENNQCTYIFKLPNNLNLSERYEVEAFAVGYDGQINKIETTKQNYQPLTISEAGIAEIVIPGEPLHIFTNLIIN